MTDEEYKNFQLEINTQVKEVARRYIASKEIKSTFQNTCDEFNGEITTIDRFSLNADEHFVYFSLQINDRLGMFSTDEAVDGLVDAYINKLKDTLNIEIQNIKCVKSNAISSLLIVQVYCYLSEDEYESMLDRAAMLYRIKNPR